MKIRRISFAHQQVFLETTLLAVYPRLGGSEARGEAGEEESSSERVQIRDGTATQSGKGGRPKTEIVLEFLKAFWGE